MTLLASHSEEPLRSPSALETRLLNEKAKPWPMVRRAANLETWLVYLAEVLPGVLAVTNSLMLNLSGGLHVGSVGSPSQIITSVSTIELSFGEKKTKGKITDQRCNVRTNAGDVNAPRK